MARVTLPTFVESFVGAVTSEKIDERATLFAHRAMKRAGITLDVHGAERIPTDQAFVYMSNHQSHMDIPVIYATVPTRTLRMVGKKELFRVPLWNRAMRAAGFIEIDRGDRSKAIASLDRAANQIRGGTSIWIAPEGSRSRTGRLGPLKKGGFHLARNAGVPIVPAAIAGTFDVLPPGATGMRGGCHVRVVFGEPIDVSKPIEELMSEVETFLKANNGHG